MKKIISALGITVIFILFLFAFGFSQEEITITTYYPSPYGNYRELRAQQMAIGFNYVDSGANPWDIDGGDPEGAEIRQDADLVVEGNVGIGTLNPSGRLDVEGLGGLVVSGRNLDPAGGYSLTPLQNSGNLLTGWNRSAGAGEIDLISNRQLGSIGGFRFYDYTNAGALNQLVTFQGDGNVGIGTAAPELKLHISDTTGVTTFTGDNNQGFRIDNNLVGNNYSLLGFGGWSGFPRNLAQIGAKFTGVGSYLSFGTSNNYAAGITNEAMVIDYNGNVGIGTINPQGKLDMANNTIVNVADPVNDQDAANKRWVLANSGNPGGWTCTMRNSGGIGGAAATCEPKEKIITGGCATDSGYISASYPEGDGTRWYWRCESLLGGNVNAFAECCI